MKVNIGTKIKELRHRDSRRQEDLANALGITYQAVSRWESGAGYPDMEMIPAIANYFNVSIDELFGYSKEREEKLKNILQNALKAFLRRHIQTSVLYLLMTVPPIMPEKYAMTMQQKTHALQSFTKRMPV